MDQEQYLKNLLPPRGLVDVVMDTDAFTEIDDLYAISYMLLRPDKFQVKGICAAPFHKPPRSNTPADGMKKSYAQIEELLTLMKKSVPVYMGSEHFLQNEVNAVDSPAASFMAKLASDYTPQHPLYIIAIGAITNVASAILSNPQMKENCVVIWLGGHATHLPQGADEYNMRQDIAAARIMFGCGIPLIHLPCNGVVDRFLTTQQELSYWLKGKNALCDYLYLRTVNEAELYAKGRPWSRVIWDVTAVAWLLSSNEDFMRFHLVPSPIPGYDKAYSLDPGRHSVCAVYSIKRNRLFEDLFRTLTSFS